MREMILKRYIILVLSLLVGILPNVGCQKYNPVETLTVEKVIVKVYFTPELNSPIQYDQYQGRIPDPQKHRLVEYDVTLKNTGKEDKKFILVEPVKEPAFERFIINEGMGIPGYIPSGKAVSLEKIYYLTEGDPKEIERLAYQSKVRIVWEEGGKKWEKIASVEPEK